MPEVTKETDEAKQDGGADAQAPAEETAEPQMKEQAAGEESEVQPVGVEEQSAGAPVEQTGPEAAPPEADGEGQEDQKLDGGDDSADIGTSDESKQDIDPPNQEGLYIHPRGVFRWLFRSAVSLTSIRKLFIYLLVKQARPELFYTTSSQFVLSI